jgi:hypothetical protein
MRYWLTIVILITANLVVSRCAEAECFANPRQVWREYPRAHATWNYIDGKQCWRRGYPQHASRERHRSYGMAVSLPPVPIPRERPVPKLTPEQGRALARELFGE